MLPASGSKITAPYGTWKSEISLELITSQSNHLEGVRVCPFTKRIFIDEGRPDGQTCIVELFLDGKTHDVLPKPFSVKSSVHEYGGGAWNILCKGRIIFSNASDNHVYVLNVDTSEVQCIIKAVDRRYADFDPHPLNERWILAIEEDHRASSVQNCITLIDLDQQTAKTLVKGADFFTSPRFSPDGLSFCWLQWNHPEMPWTGAELFWAECTTEESSVSPHFLAGGENQAAGEPRWSQDGTLYYLSEASEFRGLFKSSMPKNGISEEVKLPALNHLEFGRTEFRLGSISYNFLSPKLIIAVLTKYGSSSIFLIDVDEKHCTDLDLPIRDVLWQGLARHSETSFFIIGSTEKSPDSLYKVDVKSKVTMKRLRATSDKELPTSLFSQPEQLVNIESDKANYVYGFFFPPHNPKYQAPESQKPPLIVIPHGGPTGCSKPGLSLIYQYWTSRGFAICLLNYHGSSGHGRTYRTSLDTKWGLLDPEDAVTAIKYLCSTDRADATRVGIVGGSAGGYCVLQSICLYPKVFAGAISEYGISDLNLLIGTTHKFESHYADKLLFEKDATEEQRNTILRDRSPLFHANNISCPLLLLQGADDHVVPPDQAKKMAEEISARGGVVKLLIFPGEGHGFRQAKSIRVSMTEKLAWWHKTLVRGDDELE